MPYSCLSILSENYANFLQDKILIIHENTISIDIVDECVCYRLPSDIAELDLTVEKMPRQDVVFIKKNGPLFCWHIHDTLQLSNNKVDNFETVYTTMVLLFLELGADEVILDIFRLALEIQVCHPVGVSSCSCISQSLLRH